MALLNWIKVWNEFRLRLTLRFLVPAGAGIPVSWGAADGQIESWPQACIQIKCPSHNGRFMSTRPLAPRSERIWNSRSA